MALNVKQFKQFMEQSKQRKKALGFQFNRDGYNFFQIKEDGDYEVRVLDIGMFLVGAHWGILEGRNGNSGSAIKCPAAYYDDDKHPCPVCDLVRELALSDKAEDIKRAESMALNLKYPILLVDVNEPKVPKIYEAPPSVVSGLNEFIADARYGDLTDLNTGRNVIIRRTKEGKKTVYKILPDPNQSVFEVDFELPDLRVVFEPRSYEDIQHAIEYGDYPMRNEEDQKPAQNQKISRPPTNYNKGLPAPKTRDEDQTDGEGFPKFNTPGYPKQAARPAPAPVAPKAAPVAEEAEATPVSKTQAVAAPAKSASSLKDRLASLRSARAS